MNAAAANEMTTKPAGKSIAPATMPSINGEVESAGVTMRDIRTLGKKLGLNQDFAIALWDTRDVNLQVQPS